MQNFMLIILFIFLLVTLLSQSYKIKLMQKLINIQDEVIQAMETKTKLQEQLLKEQQE